MGKRFVLVPLAALSCLVACTAEQEAPEPAPTVTVTSRPQSFPPAVPNDAETQQLEGFKTPSGNITCAFTPEVDDTLTCFLASAEFPQPPKEPNCEFDWMPFEITFARPFTSMGNCRSDFHPAADPNKPVLDYGAVNTFSGVTCFSEDRGLSCWEGGSNHGFFVSRSVFATF